MDKYKFTKGYNPFMDLREFIDDEYFESMVIEYYQEYKRNVLELKEMFGYTSYDDIDKVITDYIIRRHNNEIQRVFSEYTKDCLFRTREENEDAIKKLKRDIRRIKDIILAIEPTDRKRLEKIDKDMGNLIDNVTLSLGFSDDIIENDTTVLSMNEFFENYKNTSVDSFDFDTMRLRELCSSVCDYYRNNFSVSLSMKYINKLNNKLNKTVDYVANSLGVVELEEKKIENLVNNYNLIKLVNISFGKYIDLLKVESNELKEEFLRKYSPKMADRLVKELDRGVSFLIDKVAYFIGYPDVHDGKLKEIFKCYNPKDLDIFDISLYKNKEDVVNARLSYEKITKEEKKVFEMKMYEQYIRIFKGKIRELGREIREVYSENTANQMVNSFNRRADELIMSKALTCGKPIPKNPWIIRKYLWSDPDNFISDRGIKFRKIINPILRECVKLAMDNKLFIEERANLDPTKEYIFVSTHYFTEDIIGLFASLDRQAYMLMGTTDQIENNPLMAAGVLFGLYYVDREDTINRQECVLKQNKLIKSGTSAINYVGGSWENSENELQPLSFSGPYKTSVATGALVVPVGSYLDRDGKAMYVRFGEPMDLSKMDEVTANEKIRDTLATIHFKQMVKHSQEISSSYVEGYGRVHDLPYDQHTYYMEQIGKEYWNQFWSKPFAKEEIGLRRKKDVVYEDVYSFVDNLSRDKLIELAGMLSEPLVRRDECVRYNVVDYIDNNYTRYRDEYKKKKVKNK